MSKASRGRMFRGAGVPSAPSGRLAPQHPHHPHLGLSPAKRRQLAREEAARRERVRAAVDKAVADLMPVLKQVVRQTNELRQEALTAAARDAADQAGHGVVPLPEMIAAFWAAFGSPPPKHPAASPEQWSARIAEARAMLPGLKAKATKTARALRGNKAIAARAQAVLQDARDAGLVASGAPPEGLIADLADGRRWRR